MRTDELPSAIWNALGLDPGEVTGIAESPLSGGTGAASGKVGLITLSLGTAPARRLVRKSFRPLATALGRWHRADATDLAISWLADDQLAQRIAVTELDWTSVDLDPRLAVGWAHRDDHLARLARLPRTIAHGDFGIGNLRTVDDTVVAIDWATLGGSPLGFDLGHLALSTLDDTLLASYLDAVDGRYDPVDVAAGFRTTVTLVGASRAHWMAERSLPLPSGYVEFVCAHLP